MKRQIKFRGKDSNNSGKWRYGSLLSYPDDNYVIVEFDGQDELAWDVDPDTVGQFTGLCDKDGKEIYEGDIVKFDNWTNIKGEVKYNGSGFYIGNSKRQIATHRRCGLCVFGNVHDNPELLKGGEK